MRYVIYDGTCNLCVTWVRLLESIDQGQQFCYAPMQDTATLERLGITAADCELGMILVEADQGDRRWQGSDAAEEIGRSLPLGDMLVAAYRGLPGMKWAGDRLYEQVRDHRYQWFGQRDLYTSAHTIPEDCTTGTCPQP
jgi:predicted DCC family thiol-disulfide oxidoreductase YuxK